MDQWPQSPTGDVYLHVRVLLGMVVGLGMTHLLRHFARIVVHPTTVKVYGIHLVWVFSMFLFLLHFWWWEFHLAAIHAWNFNLYLFVVIYALLLYLLCALILPEQMDDYSGYREYFYSRKGWFFAVMAVVYVLDYVDTAIKGGAYLHSFGIEYPIRNISYIVLCLVAMRTRQTWFHATFAVASVLYQLSWIARAFETL
jgi:hypothetical protein